MNLQRFAHFSACFTQAALVMGTGALVGFASIDAFTKYMHNATVEQCENQAWPAHQHDDHVAFCEMYLSEQLQTSAIKAGVAK